MFRQFAPIAALALTAAPLLPLNNNVATAQPSNQNAPQLIASAKKNSCVKVRLDRYKYRGEGKRRIKKRVIKRKFSVIPVLRTKVRHVHFDKLFFDWHVDCYNQNRPPYVVNVTSYYGPRRFTAKYRGTASQYVFKTRKPRKYRGRKPDFVKIKISVVGNKGRYHYRSGKLRF
ncbi:hypothetical protein IQ266_08515 [filamentous cyanobacterium LEGE 11480]|uniref:Uncharacterized protein n=1 Tax=Romeriopsis navalis LEGE 11480 TaxID=2777977 RepID=A0A928VL70_9CYAN|nr:hypothetical protein [Romeriopsis navalis]MBE9029768.1 hypothetical protein [Romeriopsis navalis LEGE 11480]